MAHFVGASPSGLSRNIERLKENTGFLKGGNGVKELIKSTFHRLSSIIFFYLIVLPLFALVSNL